MQRILGVFAKEKFVASDHTLDITLGG